MQSEASTPGERDSQNHDGVGSIELCLPTSDDSVLTVKDMLFFLFCRNAVLVLRVEIENCLVIQSSER